MAIISINGKIKSGKDTVGNIINYFFSDYELGADYDPNKQYCSKWEVKKFAKKIKDFVCIILNCTPEELESQEFKSTELDKSWWVWKLDNNTNCPTIISYEGNENLYTEDKLFKTKPRDMLQLIGTEGGRKIIHPDIWVNALFSEYTDPQNQFWCITDLRFPNEMDRIKKLSGLTIRVIRPETDILSGTHESEIALDNRNDFDYTVINNKSIYDLVEKIKTILIVENYIKCRG